MATIVCELKWLKDLFSCLGCAHLRHMNLYCDNQVALHITTNHVSHEHTKHIEVDYHFVLDELSQGTIATSHVSSHAQLVDIFIKALGKTQFDFIFSKLGICNPYAPT